MVPYTDIMTLFDNSKADYVNLSDGRTVLDLYDSADKTALFLYVVDNPKHRAVFDELIDSRDISALYEWVEALGNNVISNGSQKSYLAHVFRECVMEKFPSEKENYQKLKDEVNKSSNFDTSLSL